MSQTCTFSGGNSPNVTATVTYEGDGENAKLTGFTVSGGNSNPKYPSYDAATMIGTVTVTNGQLGSAMVNLNDSHMTDVFSCEVSNVNNGFAWLGEDGSWIASDSCTVSC